MDNKRREFLKMSAITGLSIAGSGNIFNATGAESSSQKIKNTILSTSQQQQQSIIGAYGPWATGENSKSLPSHSFRNPVWKKHKDWQAAAKKITIDRMGIRNTGPMPQVVVKKEYDYDGLHIEELSWQLPMEEQRSNIIKTC
jgi:hypothetical protein